MDLNLREIFFFLKIVELGSLSSAARMLSMSQPTLSRALRRLEERLGSELFVRHTTGMDLTSFGAVFLAHAQVLQADANRTVEDLSLLKGTSKGTARVGILASVANFLMPPVFESIFRDTPDIRIQIIEASSIRLISELEYGNIDFAVASAVQAQDNMNIHSTVLLGEPLRVICRPGHPLTKSSPCDIVDLLAYPWIVPEKGNSILLELKKMFIRAGINPPTSSISANSGNILKTTVATSDFLTMLPALATRWEEQHGILASLALTVENPYRELSVVRRAGRPLLPAANLVLSKIRRVASTLDLENNDTGMGSPQSRDHEVEAGAMTTGLRRHRP